MNSVKNIELTKLNLLNNSYYFFVHLGQNHLPSGWASKPTHPKWNHSIGHYK